MDQTVPYICMFCGVSYEEAAPVHIWPAWMRVHLESPDEAREHLNRHVCDTCSGGWLARLDEAAAPLLESAVAHAEPKRWTQADQRSLSVFVVKTVMLLEYTRSDDPGRFFTDNERWLLMRMLDPPSNDICVWAAALSESVPVRYHASRVTLLRRASGSRVGDAFIATIAVGRIAFQMAARRFFEPRPDLEEVVFPNEPSAWHSTSILLWPSLDTSSRDWPPAGALDPAAVEAFGTRWNDLLNVGVAARDIARPEGTG